jgi:periplasmic protein TonB
MRTASLVFIAVAIAAGQTARTESPVLVQKVEPEYTDTARQAGVSGTVLLSAVIGEDGRAHDVRVLRGLGYGLDAKAIDAVRKWRFRPGMKNGVVVNTAASIEVRFGHTDNSQGVIHN